MLVTPTDLQNGQNKIDECSIRKNYPSLWKQQGEII